MVEKDIVVLTHANIGNISLEKIAQESSHITYKSKNITHKIKIQLP